MRATAHAFAATVMTAIALAGLSTSGETCTPVFVVIQNQAAVPAQVLTRAIHVVTEAYRPLGIGIDWTERSAGASAVPTVHVTLLRRRAGRTGEAKMLGIDAPGDALARVHLAHILYQTIDDDVVTTHALGYVLAPVIRGALSSGATGSATIIHADRRAARTVAKGAIGVYARGGRSDPKARRIARPIVLRE